jgi:hypothetical protein
MDLFNDFIGDHHLREVIRVGPKYTWTKKQSDPVLVNLDIFFISLDWEDKFPLCMAWSLTRVGFDHSPIILGSGEQGAPRPRYFSLKNSGSCILNFTILLGANGWRVRKGDQG